MSATRVVICSGTGGVGKTTCSAALGLALASAGLRCLVLTVDPARRLADALQMEAGDDPCPVPLQPEGPGRLDALMLDRQQTFHDLVRELSPSQEQTERILENRYYQFAAQRLAGVQEYMASLKLLQLAESEDYDLIVMDTPPAAHALDILRGPKRLAELFDESLLSWLLQRGGSSRWLERGAQLGRELMQRLIGAETIQEIAEFFQLFSSLWVALRDRSRAIETLLQGERCSFFMVLTPEASLLEPAKTFLEALQSEGLRCEGLLVNRALPRPEPVTEPVWEAPPACPPEASESEWQALCQQLQAAPERAWARYHAEQELLERLTRTLSQERQWRLPSLGLDLEEAEGLLLLAEALREPVEFLLRPSS